MEIFKEINIEGLKHYKVSNLGRVSNGKKIMKDFYTSDGYKRICLVNKGIPRKYMVHRLVALTFIGEPNDINMQVNHINCIRDDNNVENLEWVTIRDNIMHAIKNGKLSLERLRKQAIYANEMACKARRKKVKLINIDTNKEEIFNSLVELEKETGICRKAIGSVCRGERKTHKGYTAMYI